ncbi:GH39 family glycosyl hydrolase [Sphingobium algorifonticola]|uniref:Glycosyl hydrolases family 39 N-terminal catalytic domain-containing protein n=1 Tax=Sphingobium algorifonticola TaxID=2008318 RepID=A0A437JAH5_9SPHN|nr:hypothetical protein [Sphingobium algorifonticola]RVT42292.1 hypothetical protein ENE74_08830 [Sphingobium algorifonticola]
MNIKAGMLLALAMTISHAADAQTAEQKLTLIGELAPKDAKDIADSTFSIGTETIDRDFSRYDAFKAYLAPLGAKHARLQSGWARTDKGSGRYDFKWLDPIVDDMNAKGVRPWISLGYGNPAYEGGGSAQRDTDLPKGVGRAAWLNYVRAIVTRYRGKVDYWELWNEPDLIAYKFTADEFAAFAAETAKVVRAVQPDATISIAGFAGSGSRKEGDFVRQATRKFVELGGRGLANVVGIHIYNARPEGANAAMDALIPDVRAIDPGLTLRQGESGAPSINAPFFALSNMWWTEEAQAKWVLRRMLNDVSRGMWTSVFTITDLHYSTQAEQQAGFNSSAARKASAMAFNTKGLLETRRYDGTGKNDDKTVVRPKQGYRAMQAVTSIFDARLKPATDAVCAASNPAITVAPFRRDDGQVAIAAWRSTDRPGEKPLHEDVDVRCTGITFTGEPVYADLLTNMVYRTKDMVGADSGALTIKGLPVYDAPVLISDTALIDMW